MTPQLATRLRQALALHQHRRHAEAKAIYREVLASAPDAADAVHMLGVTMLQSGDFSEALQHLRRAATLFEWRLPAVRHNLGLVISALLADPASDDAQRMWEDYDRWRDSLRGSRSDVSPLVSVVIPSFNHVEYINGALQSVFDQTYKKIELVVIDDGSSDGSAERIRAALKRCPHPCEFVARENHGAAKTINEAVALCRGDFVNVLNSDDRFAPSRVETMVEAVARCGVPWGFSRVALVDSHGVRLAPEASPRAKELSYLTDGVAARETVGLAFLAGNPAISSGSLFFARSLFDRLEGFGDFRYNHDWDFCLRASVIAEPVFVPSIEYEYRLHAANTILESAAAAKREADAMLGRFYETALSLPAAPNPFAPVAAVWGKRYLAQALACGHAHILPTDAIRQLAEELSTVAAGQPA